MIGFLIILVSIVAIVFGAVSLCRLPRKLRMARASESWPVVSGTIIRSDVMHTRGVSHPRLAYTYRVDGEPYTSTSHNFLNIGLAKHEASAILQRYPLHAQVTVYYNPNNPGESVLDRSIVPIDILFYLLYSIGMVALGVVFIAMVTDTLPW